MIKFIFYFLFSCITLLCSAQNKEFKVYYNDKGNKISEGYLLEGKPDGYWKTYYENGILKSQGNRKQYLLDSTWIFYDDNGAILSIINYKENKLHGVKKVIQKDIITEEYYENNKKEGKAIIYFSNGKIKQLISYQKDKKNGTAIEFDTTTIPILLVEYKNDYIIRSEKINRTDKNGLKQGCWKQFYPSFKQDNIPIGPLKLEENYLNNQLHGYVKKYGIYGELQQIEKYKHGVLVEDAEELQKLDIKTDYYPSGKIMIMGSYKKDIPEGITRYYNESGEITRSILYKNGDIIAEGIVDLSDKKQGFWKEYYSSDIKIEGKRVLKSSGQYMNGNKIGEWKYFHSNGKLEQIGNYDNSSKKQGKWQWFYESGNLRRINQYKNNLLEGETIEYFDYISQDSTHIILKGHYDQGLEEGFWYYKIGDELVMGAYQEGKKWGEWNHYYMLLTQQNKRQLTYHAYYMDDVLHGKEFTYWPNGNKKIEGNYVMGVKEGEWKYYNQYKELFLTITYNQGVEVKYDTIKLTQ